jgi:hypothetical protein
MIQALLMKNLIPFLMGMILATASILGVIHYTQKSINVSCPPPEITISEVKCPAANSGFEVEKMKGFKGKIEVIQHYTIEGQTDSLMIRKIVEQMMREPEKVKLRKKEKRG